MSETPNTTPTVDSASQTQSAPNTDQKLDTLISLMTQVLEQRNRTSVVVPSPVIPQLPPTREPVYVVPGNVENNHLLKGTVVIYRDATDVEHPAVVLRVHSDTQIDVFVLASNSMPSQKYSVLYSEQKLPGTWCFQDEQEKQRAYE